MRSSTGKLDCFLALAAALLVLPSIAAADEGAGEREKRVLYDRLVADIRLADGEVADVLHRALIEARRDDAGRPSPATAARILELRDRRDRLVTRAAWIGTLNGWEAPEFTTTLLAGDDATSSPTFSALDGAFRIVRAALRRDALRIARGVAMPPVSIPATMPAASSAIEPGR